MLGWNEWSANNYKEKYSIRFKRWAKEVRPTFNVRRYFPEPIDLPDTNKVIGTFKFVLFNDEKEITKKDGMSATIPAKFVAVVEDGEGDEKVVYYVEVSYDNASQMRSFLNSLLSVNEWDRVEFFTKETTGKDGKKYKVINVSNPDVKKEINYTDKKTGEAKTATVNEGYPWAIPYSEVPEITVLRDGDEIIKVKDEEANEFFKQKILEKFSVDKKEGWEEATADNLPF